MVDLLFWKYPLSLVSMLAYLLVFVLLYVILSRKGLSKAFTGPSSSVFFLAVISILLAIEGTWKINLFRSWGFIVISLAMNLTLGFAIIDGIRRKCSLSFLFSHLGLFLIVIGCCFGAPDFSDTRLVANYEKPTSLSISPEGMMKELPFAVKLKDFHIDCYEDGQSPKQYTSVLEIDGREMITSVNHPCRHGGYLIYQSDYDKDGQQYSVLKLVRDPWLPLVFLGIIILAAGAFIQLGNTWHSKLAWVLIVALAIVFGFISLAKINFGTLVPALRSIWFVPHIIIYMLAYSVLALSLISGVAGYFSERDLSVLSVKLLESSSALLLLGMSCGAIWAKYAWGDYWTWDGKECWAAVTWLLTLCATHLPAKEKKLLLVFIFIAFAAMQVTWYGVDYLPSSSFSLHTYK